MQQQHYNFELFKQMRVAQLKLRLQLLAWVFVFGQRKKCENILQQFSRTHFNYYNLIFIFFI